MRPESRVRALRTDEENEWLRLRVTRWPDLGMGCHRGEMAAIKSSPSRNAVLVSPGPNGSLQGFVEVSIRDYAEGCCTLAVGYLEGWYVEPEAHGKGLARELIAAAEDWALGHGCREMASDSSQVDAKARVTTAEMGYREVSRCVHYRKPLA